MKPFCRSPVSSFTPHSQSSAMLLTLLSHDSAMSLTWPSLKIGNPPRSGLSNHLLAPPMPRFVTTHAASSVRGCAKTCRPTRGELWYLVWCTRRRIPTVPLLLSSWWLPTSPSVPLAKSVKNKVNRQPSWAPWHKISNEKGLPQSPPPPTLDDFQPLLARPVAKLATKKSYQVCSYRCSLRWPQPLLARPMKNLATKQVHAILSPPNLRWPQPLITHSTVGLIWSAVMFFDPSKPQMTG